MAFGPLSRRTFLRHAPAAVAAGALASGAIAAAVVPALADEQPVEYRITKEQAEALAAWQIASIELDAAWDAYLTKTGTRAEWENARFVMHDAMSEMHRRFRPKTT